MSDNFAKPVSGLGVPALGSLDVAAYPAGGQGVSLDPTGHLPVSVLPQFLTGNIGPAGAITAGNGFTVNHSATGRYIITFKKAFAAAPVVLVTCLATDGNEIITTNTPTTTSVQVNIQDATVNVDRGFVFLACQVF